MYTLLTIMGKPLEIEPPCETNFLDLAVLCFVALFIGISTGVFIAQRWLKLVEVTFHYTEEDTLQFRQTYALEMMKVVFVGATPHFPQSKEALNGLLKVTDQRFDAYRKKLREDEVAKEVKKARPKWMTDHLMSGNESSRD